MWILNSIGKSLSQKTFRPCKLRILSGNVRIAEFTVEQIRCAKFVLKTVVAKNIPDNHEIDVVNGDHYRLYSLVSFSKNI